MGWFPSVADDCLFLNGDLPELCAVVLWVDDFIFLHQTKATWQQFIEKLCTRFTVPTFGVLNNFLGMQIVFNKNHMQITQTTAIRNLLERADRQRSFLYCNATQSPCLAGVVWTRKDCPTPPETSERCTHYRALIALANFIASWTRPDISYVVGKLCKFMSNPGPVHWQALKHLLRYLKGTSQVGLEFDFRNYTGVHGLHGYTDASYADCPDTSRSTIGYLFFYGHAVLSWSSKLHSFALLQLIMQKLWHLLKGLKRLSGLCICSTSWSPRQNIRQCPCSLTMPVSFL